MPAAASIAGADHRRSPAVAAPAKSVDARVSGLISAVAAGGGAAIALALPDIVETVSSQFGRVTAMLALTLVLQLFSVRVYGRGSVSVSAIGILAAAFLLNAGVAMALAVVAALAQWLRSRG